VSVRESSQSKGITPKMTERKWRSGAYWEGA